MTRDQRRYFTALALLVALGCLIPEVQYTYKYSSHQGRLLLREEGDGPTTPTTVASRKDNGPQHTDLLVDTDIDIAMNDETQGEDDIHFSKTAILPLQEWEARSLQGLYEARSITHDNNDNSTGTAIRTKQQRQQQVTNDSCQPPPGIPPQCCLGTFAGMGRIIHNRRHHCAAAAPALDQLYQSQTITTNTTEQCDVCALVETLRATNQTMAFVGDSMSHQIFQGLLCEFYRRNYQVQETSFHFSQSTRKRGGGNNHPNKQSIMTLEDIMNKETSNTATTSSEPFNNTDNHHEHIQVSDTNCPGGINHCLHLIRIVKVSSPLWVNKDNDATSVTLKFFHQYRLPFADPLQQQMVLQADILILNFGLHWGSAHYNTVHGQDKKPNQSSGGMTSPDNPPTPEHLQQVLAEFLEKAQHPSSSSQHAPPQIMVRETSAQHFDAPEGDYSHVKHQTKRQPAARKQSKQNLVGAVQSDGLQRSPLQCVPYNSHTTTNGTTPTMTTTSGWRERVIRQAAIQANYSVWEVSSSFIGGARPNVRSAVHPSPLLTILPFAEHTQPLHDLHPYDDRGGGDAGGGGDCTHYCSSPFLYMPLWRSIRAGAAVALKQQQQQQRRKLQQY